MFDICTSCLRKAGVHSQVNDHTYWKMIVLENLCQQVCYPVEALSVGTKYVYCTSVIDFFPRNRIEKNLGQDFILSNLLGLSSQDDIRPYLWYRD